MDNLHAPQWVDFNASDRSDVDDFFNVEHKELETGYRWNSSSDSPADSPISNSGNGKNTQHTPRSSGYASPTDSSASGGRRRFNRTSESLAKAMSALHIKSARKALLRQTMTPGAKIPSANSTLRNDIVEDDNDIRTQEEESKTKDVSGTECPNISIQEQPQTLSASGATAEKPNTEDNVTLVVSKIEKVDSSHEPVVKIQTADAEKAREPEPVKTEERKIPQDRSTPRKKSSDVGPMAEEDPRYVRSTPEEKPSDVHPKSKENPSESRSKCEKNPSHARSMSKDRPKVSSRLDDAKRAYPEKKNPRVKPENPRVLVNNVRRHSIAKSRRRASGQYVGLAEAVARFQNGTPKRFRSARHRDNQPAGPLPKAKQAKMKLTCPMSPALLCKTRTRAVSASSAEPQSRCRVNDAKPFAQSLRCSFAQGTSGNNTKAIKKIEKMPATVPAVKTQPMLPREVPEAAKKINNKPLVVPSLSNDPSATLSSMLSNSMMSTSLMTESMRKHTPCRKTVPTLVSCDEGKSIQQVEILHFGIPLGKTYKKNTRPIPFSFETRGKQLQNKREKNQQTQEKPMKALAKSAPSANPARKTTTSVLQPKENNESKVPLCALTFQQRNELTLKKKRELMDQIVEKEKQARIFHAKPAPHFKPVLVRGNSDSRTGDGSRAKKRGISPAPGQRGQNQESIALSNQENKAPNKAT